MDISREEDEEKWHENTRQRPMKAKRTRGLLDQSFLSSKLQQSPYPFNHPGYLIGVSLHNRHHHFLHIFIFNYHFHSNSTCSLSTFSFYVPLIQPLPFSGVCTSFRHRQTPQGHPILLLLCHKRGGGGGLGRPVQRWQKHVA